MDLDPLEPEAGPWVALDPAGLAERVRALLRRPRAGTGRHTRSLVLVDGRSGAGKTTLAEMLAQALPAALVHTDDVAWQYRPVDWVDALVAGILDPWQAGVAVSYRPPGWVQRGRPGAVCVPADTDILVVEGVGAARAALAVRAAACVWVQSDRELARHRGIARDIELGRTRSQAEDFWGEWSRFEDPHFAADRPWERADLVVDGTARGVDAGVVLVASRPMGR
ncbi:MAG: hypothetical protein V9G08_02060 [Dermatophilaceae bacterium]